MREGSCQDLDSSLLQDAEALTRRHHVPDDVAVIDMARKCGEARLSLEVQVFNVKFARVVQPCDE